MEEFDVDDLRRVHGIVLRNHFLRRDVQALSGEDLEVWSAWERMTEQVAAAFANGRLSDPVVEEWDRMRPDLEREWFAQTVINGLDELRVVALEKRAAAKLRLGRHLELVPELEALVTKHPLHEGLREQLMLALHRSGRHAEALEVYREHRRLLAEELGIEPGPDLQLLAMELGLEPEPPRPTE